jgi:hypothetical protein
MWSELRYMVGLTELLKPCLMLVQRLLQLVKCREAQWQKLKQIGE